MPEPVPEPLPLVIEPLASLHPACASRTWQTVAHPSLPIVAAASSDKTVRIYSLTSFTLLSTITGGHKRSIRTVAWKPNTRGESILATGSFDASAGIWRRYEVEGEGIKARDGEGVDDDDDEEEGGGGGDGDEMDFTSQKRGGNGEDDNDDDDDDDDDDWKFSIVLEGHESEIKSVAWSAGGQYLATCSRDKSVWIWEEMGEDDFETVAVLQEHDGDVKTVVWHPQEDLLASASYDDTIRLYREDLDDWSCISVLRGHDSTVWSLVFEPLSNLERAMGSESSAFEGRRRSGPRLLSASDDQTIRVWRRTPKEGSNQSAEQSYPSILRTNNIEEDWQEEARLPQRHGRAIYSLDWSKESGRVASTGSDGKIVVYEERATTASTDEIVDESAASSSSETEWVVVAEIEGAHDVFEINHISWVMRRDRGRRDDKEEVLISTGDDGEVKLWTIGSVS